MTRSRLLRVPRLASAKFLLIFEIHFSQRSDESWLRFHHRVNSPGVERQLSDSDCRFLVANSHLRIFFVVMVVNSRGIYCWIVFSRATDSRFFYCLGFKTLYEYIDSYIIIFGHDDEINYSNLLFTELVLWDWSNFYCISNNFNAPDTKNYNFWYSSYFKKGNNIFHHVCRRFFLFSLPLGRTHGTLYSTIIMKTIFFQENHTNTKYQVQLYQYTNNNKTINNNNYQKKQINSNQHIPRKGENNLLQ